MKTALLIAIAVVSVSSSTPPVSGGMSWCDYARAVGRDMTGCSNEPPVSILPAPPQILPAINPCAKIFCIATTTCVNGQCVPLSSGSCPANEEFVSCSTCETPCGKSNVACPLMCGPPKCECVASKGFARDSNGRCVPQSQCPAGNNPGKSVGCAATTCLTGQRCVEEQVQCYVPPCYPITTCVPISG
uniref:TIL domain-containing protein n=1 Tax=Plectus sambesii TaxID=2011161 RepID=A0A914X022_9BILA